MKRISLTAITAAALIFLALALSTPSCTAPQSWPAIQQEATLAAQDIQDLATVAQTPAARSALLEAAEALRLLGALDTIENATAAIQALEIARQAAQKVADANPNHPDLALALAALNIIARRAATYSKATPAQTP